MTGKTYKHNLLRCVNCPNLKIKCNEEMIPWLSQFTNQKIDYFVCDVTKNKVDCKYLDTFPPDCPLEDWKE